MTAAPPVVGVNDLLQPALAPIGAGVRAMVLRRDKYRCVRPRPRVLEFFAGVGLARMGLDRAGFETAWANDISADKAAMYRAQFDDAVMEVADVNDVDAAKLPRADLAWASSPCTDLSLAGNRTGLAGAESSAFYAFAAVLRAVPQEDRPAALVLENVIGLSTSHAVDQVLRALAGDES